MAKAERAISSMSPVVSSSTNFIAYFTLENASSIGFRSGEYGGKNVQEQQYPLLLSLHFQYDE